MNNYFITSNRRELNLFSYNDGWQSSLLYNKQFNVWDDAILNQQDLLSQYCIWTQPKLVDENINVSSIDDKPRRGTLKPKGHKVLILKRNNFSFKANKLLESLQNIQIGSITLVSPKKKAESKLGPLSSKRSTYIGVSRNGHNWQALITINKKKTYIGSYWSEIDAAIAFDFFSILLHSFIAKTNFSYTKDNIVEMILNFKTNGECLKPEYLSFI